MLSLFIRLSLLLLMLCALDVRAHAHAVGETYVWINVEADRITGRVEINLSDLREDLDIPIQDSGEGRLAILNQYRDKVLEYLRERFQISASGTELPIEYTVIKLLDLPNAEGNYAQYYYRTPLGPVPDEITILNSLLVDTSFTHRSLVCIERNQKSGQVFAGEFTAMVFGAHNPVQTLDLTHIETLLRPRQFIWQGVLHIWIGIDHILFIVTLLLPAVLADQDGQWVPVPRFRTAFWNIVKIVTIFTVAHSITLSLASLGVVRVPSRLVESVIALSIVLIAVLTISPRLRSHNWQVIFGFGLFHGLGFASVMSDLPFRMVDLVKVLIGFNVGVELGQIGIVACVFPILYLLRKTSVYVPWILHGGSFITAIIGAYWFVERALGFS